MSEKFSALTQLTEDEMMFKDMVYKFAEEQVKPHSAEMDRDGNFRPELIKQFFDLGLMGIEIPEQYGGTGSSFFMSILAIEALAMIDASAAIYVDVQNTLVNNALLRWADDSLKKKYFPQLASQKLGAYALSEAGSGSDAFALKARAEEKADHYILNGQKMWITNGGEAELFIVFANARPEAGYKGITAFLIEKGFPGFSVGKKEDKLGIRASSTCELILDNCVVPKENVIGEVGKGYKVAIETLNEGRIGIGAQMLGISNAALNYAMQYSKERQQFGKNLAEFQAIQFQIADMATQLEAARLLVYNAARLKDARQDFLKEAAMAKIFSSRAAEKITSQVLEIYGGYGYTKEYPVEKLYRDAKIGQIYEGTSNMQLQTIAKYLLFK
ncbi:MAG: acyl-CoA dehydrogenase [Caldithrix sp. RBG_13_44_9]|nr:MAG: acyl-CoA dehydrogenase [Caldithrix sp. RBG_13_44_9]